MDPEAFDKKEVGVFNHKGMENKRTFKKNICKYICILLFTYEQMKQTRRNGKYNKDRLLN